jgi:hypothetical protein
MEVAPNEKSGLLVLTRGLLALPVVVTSLALCFSFGQKNELPTLAGMILGVFLIIEALPRSPSLRWDWSGLSSNKLKKARKKSVDLRATKIACKRIVTRYEID